jgi:hypothetical protein
MQSRPSLNHITRFIKTISFLLFAYFGLSILMCVTSLHKTKIIDVQTKNLKENTYNRVEIGKNAFLTGSEGQLHWKVDTMSDAFLVGFSNVDGVGNFYDLFYFLFVVIAIFFMVRRLTEETIFSDHVIEYFNVFGYLIILYPIMGLISYKISAACIEELTGGKFTSQLGNTNLVKYIMIAFLLRLIVLFFKKAKSLQQENELTI